MTHGLKAYRRKLREDPQRREGFYTRMVYFWLVNLIGVFVVFFFAPGIWAQSSMLYLIAITLWANFAHDLTAE